MNKLNTLPGSQTLEALKKAMNCEPEIILKEPALDEFKEACEFLSERKEIRNTNYYRGSSFYIKTFISRYSGVKVSNEAVIAAAIHLGIKYKLIDGLSEVALAISSKGWPGYDERKQK